MTTTKEEVAALKERVSHMESRQDQMFEVVKEIKATTDENRGARRALHMVYIIVMAVVTLKFGDIAALFK